MVCFHFKLVCVYPETIGGNVILFRFHASVIQCCQQTRYQIREHDNNNSIVLVVTFYSPSCELWEIYLYEHTNISGHSATYVAAILGFRLNLWKKQSPEINSCTDTP